MRKFILISSSLLLILIIRYIFLQQDKFEVHPFIINSSKIKNIAHRGGMGLGPENTMITFQKAIEVGADILEMDIHSTSDSVLILLHDHKVDRISNGFGYVWNYSFERLSQLNAGYFWTNDDSLTFPFRKLEIKIPTLNEIFESFNNFRLNIEIKQNEPYIIKNMCKMIQNYDMENKVLIGSFINGVLEEFRKECPTVATSSGIDETKIYYTLNYLQLDWLYNPSLDVFELPRYYKNRSILTKQFIIGSHKKNIPIYVWTINKKEEMKQLIKLGVDGIITDYPDRLSKILNP